MCLSEAFTAREIGAPGMRCTRMGTAERMSQAWWKAASRGGDQSNSLPGPLRALVRRARIKAAFNGEQQQQQQELERLCPRNSSLEMVNTHLGRPMWRPRPRFCTW